MIRRASDNTPNKFASNAFLRSPQLRKKAKRLATVLKSSQQRLRRLTAKVQRLIQHEGVNLTSENSADFASLMSEARRVIVELYPSGSFRRIFWDEQEKALTEKSKRGIRWHPLIIRWALNLKMRSGAAYQDMSTSGFITLPSVTTRIISRKKVDFRPR